MHKQRVYIYYLNKNLNEFYLKLKNLIKDVSGNSLGEFAVTVALMAILVVTAMPKLSSIGKTVKSEVKERNG